MRDLAEELAKPLSIIYQQSWLSGKVPDDWKLANVMPIHKKGCKEDLGNYRPVSLTSMPDKVMEQIILSAITQHPQDGQGIRSSQHGFRRGRSCLTNLISFYDQVIHLVDEGKAVGAYRFKIKESSKQFKEFSPAIYVCRDIWKLMSAAFHSKDARYNLASFLVLLHAAYFPVIELPVSSGKIYLKSVWGEKQQENLDIAIITGSSCVSL
ncbi:hypothetical protein WISP_84246 [Willisornis vidua]|uniref:Reverse transcriptase domain-containing protein n=1 Tax=Willisornis vidua TaxID=1566151 RepID=A0ABQ9D3M7_9PASS|nr:hypothetical protein WISP_84246 [Willisornis vidua]